MNIKSIDLSIKDITKNIEKILRIKDKVTIGLSGGRSVYIILNRLKFKDIFWNKVYFFLIDERITCNKKELNENYLKNIFFDFLLQQGKISSNQIIIAKNAKKYSNKIKAISGFFDIIILGCGEDGHIASLFPQKNELKNKEKYYIKISDSPKLPRTRITASRKLVEDSHYIYLIFNGGLKKKALANFLDEDVDVFDCPAKITKKCKNLTIINNTI